MPTIAETVAAAATRLQPAPDARLEAELLLCHLLGRNRSYLRTWPERQLTVDEAAAFEALLARRAAGEPLAYITGEREFWSLRLRVTPATLIPRADTETLVEQVLARIPPTARWQIADLGTGSGAIALAIARERPACTIVATDHSAAALEVARDNAGRNAIANVEFRNGSWFAPLAGERFDLIVSNPPYIAAGDPHLHRGDLPYEPATALASGTDGLDAIGHIVAGAAHHLHPGGWLLLEHGYDQGAAVRELLNRAGFSAVVTERDPGGNERVSGGRCD